MCTALSGRERLCPRPCAVPLRAAPGQCRLPRAAKARLAPGRRAAGTGSCMQMSVSAGRCSRRLSARPGPPGCHRQLRPSVQRGERAAAGAGAAGGRTGQGAVLGAGRTLGRKALKKQKGGGKDFWFSSYLPPSVSPLTSAGPGLVRAAKLVTRSKRLKRYKMERVPKARLSN